MLSDIWVSRTWSGHAIDLDRHARFSCAIGRFRRRVAGWFARA